MNKDSNLYAEVAQQARQMPEYGSATASGRLSGAAEAASNRPKRGNPNIAGTGRIREAQQAEKNYEQEQADARAYVLQQLGAELYTLRPVAVALFIQLQFIVYRAMQVNGFWDGDQRNFAAKTALVHSELSEMLEANRKGIEHDDKVSQYTGEEAEAADTLIRLLDMGGGFDLRLGEALVDKMLYNLSRPFKHGKAY